jgi:hypothetical protein
MKRGYKVDMGSGPKLALAPLDGGGGVYYNDKYTAMERFSAKDARHLT